MAFFYQQGYNEQKHTMVKEFTNEDTITDTGVGRAPHFHSDT